MRSGLTTTRGCLFGFAFQKTAHAGAQGAEINKGALSTRFLFAFCQWWRYKLDQATVFYGCTRGLGPAHIDLAFSAASRFHKGAFRLSLWDLEAWLLGPANYMAVCMATPLRLASHCNPGIRKSDVFSYDHNQIYLHARSACGCCRG